MYRVFRAPRYGKKLSKLSVKERERVQKFEQRLKENPNDGKPLTYPFFREKKFNGKRLLFFVYHEYDTILLATITGKKTQHQDIEYISANRQKYKELVREFVARLP